MIKNVNPHKNLTKYSPTPETKLFKFSIDFFAVTSSESSGLYEITASLFILNQPAKNMTVNKNKDINSVIFGSCAARLIIMKFTASCPNNTYNNKGCIYIKLFFRILPEILNKFFIFLLYHVFYLYKHLVD